MPWIYVVLFGALGVALRFALDKTFPTQAGQIPWITLIINGLGCFLAAWITVLAEERGFPSTPWRLGLLVGFCGGFTTFSAYGLQSAMLLEQGAIKVALFYFLGSPLVGMITALTGLWVARRF